MQLKKKKKSSICYILKINCCLPTLTSHNEENEWRVENSGRFSSSTVMGNWPPTPTPTPPLSIVIGCYRRKAGHVYFLEWMFHYNSEQHGWKSHQRCKRIRCDRLFPLVKKGRGACCIVVPLIKNRRGAAFSPVLTCPCRSFFRGLQRWRCEQTLARITKFTDILKSGFWVWTCRRGGGCPEGSFSSAVTLQRDGRRRMDSLNVYNF